MTKATMKMPEHNANVGFISKLLVVHVGSTPWDIFFPILCIDQIQGCDGRW